MSEKLFIEEETELDDEPLTTSPRPKTNRKRVILNSIIGCIVVFGIIIAIIVLVSTESIKPPDPDPDHYPHFNPYFIEGSPVREGKVTRVQLINKRKQLEGNTKSYPYAYAGLPSAIIKDSPENPEIQRLTFYVMDYDEHLTRFLMDDPMKPRWQVPYYGNRFDSYSQVTRTPSRFRILKDINDSFQWEFIGKPNSTFPIISTKNYRLQYFDKYVEFEGVIQKNLIYGMGERIESFNLKDTNYSLWNRYLPYTPFDDNENGMYGSHPFILSRATDNGKDDFIAYFMRNSNAMLFSMWEDPHDATIINYKMVGGVIDLYLFHSADPQYIIRKYHSVIGRPYLPPVWAMGFHQARAGYTVKDFEEILENSHKYSLPVDALWADEEMTDGHKTFTVNSTSFAGIKDLVMRMHDPKQEINMHFVAMVNPALKVDPSYSIYMNALESDCLIMSASHYNHPHKGRTLAGPSVWLDFFVYKSTLIWAGGLYQLFELTQLDGVWITDNEINNLCNGDCPDNNPDVDTGILDPLHNASEFNYIPYRPTMDSLETGTLPMEAYHHANDSTAMYLKQYFTHNLFSIQVTKATFEALNSISEGKRVLIASRSSWPGSGQFSSHWLDGNYGTWESRVDSIPSMLNFNLFGIPHVGAPIGGFFGNCTGNLLVRWFELGSYSPLMLSYSNSNTNRKEAFADPDYIVLIRNTLIERYSLLRFMYTKMFEAFIWGGAVIHPLFFDFMNDTDVYKRNIVDTTFMWSHTLYIIPHISVDSESIKTYLPNWRWYDLKTKDMIIDYDPLLQHGRYHLFEQPLGVTTVLIKGGSIIPYQNLVREAKIMNVKDLDKLPIQIIVAPDHENKATGSMVVDNEDIRPHPDLKSNSYRHYSFTYMNQIFRINKLAGFDFYSNLEINNFWELSILDVYGKHKVDFVCMMDMHMNKKELVYSKQANSNILLIHDAKREKIPMLSLEAIVWGTSEQHNFCRYQLMFSQMQLSNNDRILKGTLENSNSTLAPVKLNFLAVAMSDHVAYLRIKTDGAEEWKVPGIIPEGQKTTPKATKSLDAIGFSTSQKHAPFYFEMADKNPSHDFWLTTRNQPFIYLKNFIQVKFMIAGRHLFGLGERVGRFELVNGIYSLWNYDAMHEETGAPPGNNMYGHHPFYLIHTQNPKDFAGVFFLTSNPMDVMINSVGMQTEVDHILTGGILELFLIGKGPAETVLRHYHELIGKPAPLPFWAFGYHQSRWGYRNIIFLKLVVQKFIRKHIPLDAIWVDKDFMADYKSFTVDTKKWHGLTQYVKELHDKGIKFVAVVDAAIARDYEFEIFTRGQAQDVYIKSSFTNDMFIGITWAGYSVWVDFVHPSATNFWAQCLLDFYALVNFDGIWLDMNEPSNFCNGECTDEFSYHYYFFPLNYYDDLYYNPTHRPIEDHTLSMEALHSGNPVLANEFNYHALYGLLQSKATHSFFIDKLNKRPFIVSRSTYPGSGQYAGHELGDNYSTWINMENSIAGMLNFNLFGIPFVGANVCGYSGDATVNLCARWMQLGAFYPFMRNHNSPKGSPQEPFIDENLMGVSKKAIQLRYSLVRYLYTEYMHTVLRGGTMVSPLIFSFPEDNNTYSTIDTSFMIGPGLRVTPILESDRDFVDTYFPNADWYHFQAPDYEKVLSYSRTNTKGKVITLHSSLDTETINLHVKSGVIICAQDVHYSVTSVLEVHNLPIYLVVVPDQDLSAYGEVLYDNEHSIDFYTGHQNIMIHLKENQMTLNMTSGSPDFNYNMTDRFIERITILGASSYKAATKAKYDTKTQVGISMKSVTYNAAKEILTLEPVNSMSMSILDLNKVYWS